MDRKAVVGKEFEIVGFAEQDKILNFSLNLISKIIVIVEMIRV